ncbi:hypothetical protein BC567DRAFT_221467 [Phyllosticta citribraziliensis]
MSPVRGRFVSPCFKISGASLTLSLSLSLSLPPKAATRQAGPRRRSKAEQNSEKESGKRTAEVAAPANVGQPGEASYATLPYATLPYGADHATPCHEPTFTALMLLRTVPLPRICLMPRPRSFVSSVWRWCGCFLYCGNQARAVGRLVGRRLVAFRLITSHLIASGRPSAAPQVP